MNVLIDGFGPDAIALARCSLAEEGPRPARRARARALRRRGAPRRGIVVEPRHRSRRHPPVADVAYLDPWTPETRRRVARLRAQGTRVSCLGDLLLERWSGPTHRHHRHGRQDDDHGTHRRDAARSRHRRRRQPRRPRRQSLADRRPPRPARGAARQHVLLLELTSSHLAFMDGSPTIAAVTSFWPDHLELHGSLRPLPRRQGDDRPASERRRPRRRERRRCSRRVRGARLPRARFEFSLLRPVAERCLSRFRRAARRSSATGDETVVGPLPSDGRTGEHRRGRRDRRRCRRGRRSDRARESELRPLPVAGHAAGTLAGIPVIDDGMAATPSKTAALLALDTRPGASSSSPAA